MKVFTAPEGVLIGWGESTIFLAGSIEQGKAANWQQVVIDALKQHRDADDLVILNPRRDAWDAMWDQTEDNPELVKQVRWELANLELADLTFFYFQAGTLSPISLLELGKVCGANQNAIVVCEPGFWRRGNVAVTAEMARIEVFDHLDAGIERLLQVDF